MQHSIESLVQDLESSIEQPISFAEMAKKETAVSKAMRPRWNSEEPRDYSIANSQPDVDEAVRKAVTGTISVDESTKLIVDDVLRRLSSDDDFRRSDENEPPEDNPADDEPAERDAFFLRSESSDGTALR